MRKEIDQSRLEDLVAACNANPGEETIRTLAALFVEKAACVDEPGKSVAKSIPAHLRGRISQPLYDRTYQTALEMTEALKAERANTKANQDGEWISLSRVSAMFNSREDILLSKLRTYEFRRGCGWPRYFLDDWRFPASAFDDARAAQYFASLPEHEPYDPPEGFERAPNHSEEHPTLVASIEERRRK